MHTVWNKSKYVAFSGPYFPVFEQNTKIYTVNHITVKIRQKKKKKVDSRY